MDLVNSVTQNSNNRSVTMENQGGGGGGGGGGSGGGSGNKGPSPGDCHDSAGQQQHMSTADSSASEDSAPMQSSQGAAAAATPPTQPGKPTTQVPDYLRAIGMDPRKFWPKKYRFTREKSPGQHNPLTIAQRNFYETNGYIVFDECAPKKLLDSIKSQHREFGDASLVSEFLLERLLMKNGRLVPYVKCFCDERLMLMTHRLIDSFNQDSTAPSAVPSSQHTTNQHFAKELLDQNQQQRQLLFRDWVFLPFRPIDKVCCAVTAIEPLEHVLLVVPGTHRVGQVNICSTLNDVSAVYDSSQDWKEGRMLARREIFECSPEKLSTLVDKSKKGFRYINLKPGQTLFYHPGLIHGFSNDLVNFRKPQLVSVAYYAAADCEYVDLRKSSPDLMQDEQAGGKRPQVPPSLAHFQDKDPRDYTSWLDKPRLLSDPRAANL